MGSTSHTYNTCLHTPMPHGLFQLAKERKRNFSKHNRTWNQFRTHASVCSLTRKISPMFHQGRNWKQRKAKSHLWERPAYTIRGLWSWRQDPLQATHLIQREDPGDVHGTEKETQMANGSEFRLWVGGPHCAQWSPQTCGPCSTPTGTSPKRTTTHRLLIW